MKYHSPKNLGNEIFLFELWRIVYWNSFTQQIPHLMKYYIVRGMQMHSYQHTRRIAKNLKWNKILKIHKIELYLLEGLNLLRMFFFFLKGGSV